MVGEAFLRPPVDLAEVVAGTFPCPSSMAPAVVAETLAYPLVNRAVWFVERPGAASRRHTGPLVVGQDLPEREQACFPMVEIRTPEIRLRAEQGPKVDQWLRQRAFAEQPLRLRSPVNWWPSLWAPKAAFRWVQVATEPV